MQSEVLCFCYHTSHVLNLGSIPALLAQRGWRVRCFNAFARDAYPAEPDAGVEYAFDVPLEALARESADLYLTPFVGQSSCFPQRALRVHFLVSLTSLDVVYDKSMFDHYDAIACAGHHHIGDFISLGTSRGWRNKVLIPLGYPKLDGQRRQLAALPQAAPATASEAAQAVTGDTPTVVFAPTHAYYVNQGLSVVGRYGERIVESILDGGMNVIFRPHIESWRDQDRPVVEQIVQRFSGHPGFALDRTSNYFDTYAKSDLMLSDVSGTGFTYAFTFGRPALFFAPDASQEADLRGIQFERRENIGLLVRSLDDLTAKLRLAHAHRDFLQQQIVDFRTWLLFNPDNSEAYFADHAATLAQGTALSPDWHLFQAGS